MTQPGSDITNCERRSEILCDILGYPGSGWESLGVSGPYPRAGWSLGARLEGKVWVYLCGMCRGMSWLAGARGVRAIAKLRRKRVAGTGEQPPPLLPPPSQLVLIRRRLRRHNVCIKRRRRRPRPFPHTSILYFLYVWCSWPRGRQAHTCTLLGPFREDPR
jgi:hypothetical protein